MCKKILYLAFALCVHNGICAQNPIETTFTVELNDENEGQNEVVISSLDYNYMRFVGGKGKVHNPITGNNTDEENQDLYGWISNLTYNEVYMQALLTPGTIFSAGKFGYCISKHPNPTISNDVVLKTINYYDSYNRIEYYYRDDYYYKVDFDMFECRDNETTYTLLIEESSGRKDGNHFFAQLHNLEYMTTYYVRPFVEYNDNIMYGGEISFTTPKTIEGALNNEPELKDWCLYDSKTSLVFNTEAMKMLSGTTEEPLDGFKEGVCGDLQRFLTDDIRNLIKTSYVSKEIECTNGILYEVQTLPADIIQAFQEYLNGGISFNPAEYAIDKETKLPGSNVQVTKNLSDIQVVDCDPSWGVPNNSYVLFPAASTTNPNVGIYIPKYLSNKTYKISIVFVIPDIENDPRTYRFRVSIWEKNQDSKYPSMGIPVKLDGNNTFESSSIVVDTVDVGTYTFNGNTDAIIQINPIVMASQRKNFTNSMCISQIILTPVTE